MDEFELNGYDLVKVVSMSLATLMAGHAVYGPLAVLYIRVADELWEVLENIRDFMDEDSDDSDSDIEVE